MRFAVELLRANPVIALGMTEYQWISLILIAVGMCRVYRTTISPAEIHRTNPKRHEGVR